MNDQNTKITFNSIRRIRNKPIYTNTMKGINIKKYNFHIRKSTMNDDYKFFKFDCRIER